MILQPFGPQRSNDSWLWHLSLSVCLEGGRAWWEGVWMRKRTKRKAQWLLYSSQRAEHICCFWWAACVWSFLLSYVFCGFAVTVKWHSDGHSLNTTEWRARSASHSIISHDLPREASAASSKWQDWLSRFSPFSVTFGCLSCFAVAVPES